MTTLMPTLFSCPKWIFKEYWQSLRSNAGHGFFKKIYRSTCFALALIFLSPVVLSDTLRIAVASNFYPTAVELRKAFNKLHSDIELTLVKGASDDLFDSIVGGASFDVFLSADETHTATLVKLKKAKPTSRKTYAFGRLAFLHKMGNQTEDHGHGHGKETITVKELGDFIAKHRNQTVYIPDPQDSPYGKRAEDLLEAAGLYYPLNAAGNIKIEDSAHDVWNNNMNKTELFALLPASLVFHEDDDHSRDSHHVKHNYPKDDEVSLLKDNDFHRLRQEMVILEGSASTKAAETFARFMLSPTTQAYIGDHGYYPASYSEVCDPANTSSAVSYFSAIPYAGILSAVASAAVAAWINRGYCRF
ncbi:substrate-binding domain-containing protein [Endozoicomonas sp. 8E]|uniref:substrate-binding domain-containing protein n=1 Tax=Endozoicomonas sp. 8E TaxID=3035692 RepID=UPI0029392028|nr:substrate-binding domain-containing protein [Endozoicomonas sp. 8E]WOG26601.1 extracellular solute-binding protein [Endozoicomonas sp. 8E]